MSLKHRVKRLAVRANTGEAADLRKHWERRWDEREALVKRFLYAIPDSRAEAVEPVLSPWVDQIYDPQWWFSDRAAPSVARWVAWLDGRGWIPNPIPEALIDLFLAHPEADVCSYDCEECGLTMPSEPTRKIESNWIKAYPYATACPHCDGRIVYNGYFNKHGICKSETY